MKWGKYTYWPFTTENNDNKLIVVAFDSNNTEVKRWEVPGYRYAIDIEIDNQNQKVTFLMKQMDGVFVDGAYPVTFDWNELKID